MNKQTRLGFSPHRISWIIAILSVLLVPCHFWVPCVLSGRIAAFAAGLLILSGGLYLISRDEHRERPLLTIFAVFIAHIMCTH
jgi:hypothetical protein